MSAISEGATQDKAAPLDPAPVFLDARTEFAARFLAGEGLEIGALHLPLATPPEAEVRYVDRMSVEKLRAEYPELASWDLTEVDVIDNGELLETVPEESQDFIVANHFLEHCEDPIRTIGTHLGKLRPGGVLFYAVPDKRYTFDSRRPLTPLEHMVADHEQGPERSRTEHYEEWTRLVVDGEAPAGTEGAAFEEWAARRSRELEEDAYSIHMHVWTQAEFLKMIVHCRERYEDAFDIEAAARQGIEFLVVLRKAGPPTSPAAVPSSQAGTGRWRRLLRRSASRVRGSASRLAKR
jgi:predicted SAM-dependent methyltransferase